METMTVRRAAELEQDAADRMRKAIRVSGLSVTEVAEQLEVNRNTVSTWINGHNAPRKRDLRDFCALTGVTVEWVETGAIWTDDNEWESVTGRPAKGEGPTTGGGRTLILDECARRDLNPRPIDP